jgi:hypothetical protein
VGQRLAPDHLQAETRVSAILLQDQMSDEPCAVRAGLPRHRMLLLQERFLLTRCRTRPCHTAWCPTLSPLVLFSDTRQRPSRGALDGTKAAWLVAQSRDVAATGCLFSQGKLNSVLCDHNYQIMDFCALFLAAFVSFDMQNYDNVPFEGKNYKFISRVSFKEFSY